MINPDTQYHPANIVAHYASVMIVMAAFGTLIGLLIADCLGETYTVKVENDDFLSERQADVYHYPDDGGFPSSEIHVTHTGGKWVGGGTGVGAALGLLLTFMYRSLWMRPAGNTSSKENYAYAPGQRDGKNASPWKCLFG